MAERVVDAAAAAAAAVGLARGAGARRGGGVGAGDQSINVKRSSRGIRRAGPRAYAARPLVLTTAPRWCAGEVVGGRFVSV